MKDFIQRTKNSLKWLSSWYFEYVIIVLTLTAVWQVLEIIEGKTVVPRTSDTFMVLGTAAYILFLRKKVRNGQRNNTM